MFFVKKIMQIRQRTLYGKKPNYAICIYRWRIKTRLNVVYKIKTMLKCLFIFVDQTRRNEML